MIFKICIFILFSVILLSHCNNLENNEKICKTKSTNCSECIQTSGCKWCQDPTLNGNRCFFNEKKCNSKDLVNPSSEQTKFVNGPDHSTVKPSEVSLKLRVGKAHKINVTMEYTDERDRPLDLYILMDLSCTMLSQKKKVEELARTLAENLKKLTNDLRMGFGSFVDKPVSPFASATTLTTITCRDITFKYKPPHLFKNHLPMTNNVTLFTNAVKDAQILTNVDVPEGGLDALMQAMSCTDEIKWRFENKARRLIVVSTDGPFHIAGDGKLGGIVNPNDGKCHLDTDGEYDHATILDYPTVSQIREKIQEQNIYVIFAVTRPHLNIYQKLVDFIGRGLSSVQSIDDGDSTIPKVIEMEYKNVVSQVKFQVPNNDYVDIIYYVKCPGSNDFEKRADCDSLPSGTKVQVKVEVELKKCPRIKSKKISIPIRPFQSTGESNMLNITVEALCTCDCEMPQQISTNNAEQCNRNGKLQCGKCKCDEDKGFVGEFCNCSKSGQLVERDLCIEKGRVHVCSNHGECNCGECVCSEGFEGKYCQCDKNNRTCPIKPGDKGMCNEEINQGECHCDACQCNKGFSGDSCQCSHLDTDCRDTSTEESSRKICNGFGKCQCGKCLCDDTFQGKWCSLQKSKFAGSCKKELMEKANVCVNCLSIDNENKADSRRVENCKSHCGFAEVVFLDQIDEEGTSECRGTVEEPITKCEILFIIGSRNILTNKIKLRTERKANCPKPPPILAIILGVVGSILCIGILTLLIWKVLTHIHDKKEFEKFEKEKASASWNLNQNPLYKATVTEYPNPAFGAEFEDQR